MKSDKLLLKSKELMENVYSVVRSLVPFSGLHVQFVRVSTKFDAIENHLDLTGYRSSMINSAKFKEYWPSK